MNLNLGPSDSKDRSHSPHWVPLGYRQSHSWCLQTPDHGCATGMHQKSMLAPASLHHPHWSRLPGYCEVGICSTLPSPIPSSTMTSTVLMSKPRNKATSQPEIPDITNEPEQIFPPFHLGMTDTQLLSVNFPDQMLWKEMT